MTDQELTQAVLDHVSATGYRPVKPRKIARALGLDDEEARDLKKAVKRLVKDGRLCYGANHSVCLPGAPTSNRISGVFRRMPGGYGFVRPAGSSGQREKAEDIYIPQKKASDASSGDVVLVQLSARRGGPRGRLRTGQIMSVVERETHRFVGTYFENVGYGFVRVDGTVFSQPILVGDAGAKNVKVDDKVVIEMVRFPSHVHEGEAVIVEVLGPRGTPGVDTLSIIHEYNLPGEFAEDALEEARARAEAFDEGIQKDRRDLTAETIITIDPFDARDFDDAISLEQLDSGHWRLGVHIADVSHFVQEKTPLDREAKDRATSVYLPDRVIPMLPEIISNNLASLQPNRIRYTKTVFIEFDPEGVRVAVEACSAAIASKRRFNYEEVDDYLADPQKWKRKLKKDVHALLARMHTLAMILRKRRLDHGALELTMPEVKIDLDRDGRVAGAHLVQHTESHQIIEEFMLAANEAVAALLSEAEFHFLRRVHEAPDPRKLQDLTSFVHDLGFDTESLESRFELQRLLHLVHGQPEEHAVNYAVLRSLQKAHYSPVDEGHYALASDCYCHFTSPIRRYPDLTVHRLLDDLLHRRTPKQHLEEQAALGDHCSDRERRAEAAERELKRVKLLDYLSERIGEEMDAVVTGVQEFGLFVEGIQLPAEGLIHVSSLQDDYYHYDRLTHTLAGHRSGNLYRLGDYVRVAVARVDVDRRELDFRLVRRLQRRPPGPSPAARSPSAKRSKRGKKASRQVATTRKTTAKHKQKSKGSKATPKKSESRKPAPKTGVSSKKTAKKITKKTPKKATKGSRTKSSTGRKKAAVKRKKSGRKR